MKKVGLFGGSFDPIHFGHISLCIQILEQHHLDEILFCPAYCSPLKTETPPTIDPKHRLEIVKLAIQDIPKCKLTSFEIDRKGPSYTIDTVKAHLKEGVQLRLILSEESAAHFTKWKDANELLQLAPPIIGARKEASLPENLKKWFTQTRIMEISSTDVRERLKKNLYCGHLIPAKSLDYIHSHRLYSK